MKKLLLTALLAIAGIAFTARAQAPQITWDRHSLMIDGRRVVPVMGEIHYSRLPEAEWANEIHKMKEGGVTVIATYVFWSHIEEQEGIFDWSGQRNLRRFIELCQAEGLPVCLRIGPFCHGEVRGGGIPDWAVESGCQLRSMDPQFLGYVERLYRQIFTQVQGLQWKDGGPVMATQFDNEFGGDGAYLMELKHIAQRIGFDLPFYTRTGWPGLRKPIPYGELLPLFGDYADGFWDRSIKEGAGSYYKAFNFHAQRTSDAIASEQLSPNGGQQAGGSTSQQAYPYFTCELGGGMMQSYHRRILTYPHDAYAMAVVKLGSGSNLLGYYMYHGGTNPEGKLGYLNETQRCLYTNYNDLPVLNYDFQAPLGEFGQVNNHFYSLRKLHLFMHDLGEQLAPMEAVFPCEQDVRQGDDSFLRWSYRTDGTSAFVFVNNYERFASLTAKRDVQFDVCGITFPQKPMTVPAGTSCIFPVNVCGIRYATAQLVACRDGNIYLEQLPGIPTEIALQEGRVLRNVKARGTAKPVYKNIYLVSHDEAGRLFLDESVISETHEYIDIPFKKVRPAGAPRTITIGARGAAEEPVDADFDEAAVYRIDLPAERSGLLLIGYRGDVARLYAVCGEGEKKVVRLVADNFYNGLSMRYGLWRLPADARYLELRILPLQEDMPVYFPREADTTPGEELLRVQLTIDN